MIGVKKVGQVRTTILLENTSLLYGKYEPSKLVLVCKIIFNAILMKQKLTIKQTFYHQILKLWLMLHGMLMFQQNGQVLLYMERVFDNFHGNLELY